VLLKYVVAGLIDAVVSVPAGLASAALASVNPVYGLYTSIAAPIGGSLLVSAPLMPIATTWASALAAGQAIRSYREGERDGAMFLLVGLVGVAPALCGPLRLGRLIQRLPLLLLPLPRSMAAASATACGRADRLTNSTTGDRRQALR
jgi:MFS superfamily sulfate permease-like transporter